jgi:hypothetical protein
MRSAVMPRSAEDSHRLHLRVIRTQRIYSHFNHFKRNIYLESITTSVASVRGRTIPTERPPLVGEVSANF